MLLEHAALSITVGDLIHLPHVWLLLVSVMNHTYFGRRMKLHWLLWTAWRPLTSQTFLLAFCLPFQKDIKSSAEQWFRIWVSEEKWNKIWQNPSFISWFCGTIAGFDLHGDITAYAQTPQKHILFLVGQQKNRPASTAGLFSSFLIWSILGVVSNNYNYFFLKKNCFLLGFF